MRLCVIEYLCKSFVCERMNNDIANLACILQHIPSLSEFELSIVYMNDCAVDLHWSDSSFSLSFWIICVFLCGFLEILFLVSWPIFFINMKIEARKHFFLLYTEVCHAPPCTAYNVYIHFDNLFCFNCIFSIEWIGEKKPTKKLMFILSLFS